MLHEFLTQNRDELTARCRTKVGLRSSDDRMASRLEGGVPVLIGQLVQTLRAEQAGTAGTSEATIASDIGTSAAHHGAELLRRGFTVEQVVHDYGDLCQAVTELAHETTQAISVEEFHTFNRILDDAIAEAVTAFCRERERRTAEVAALSITERLARLAHGLRHQLNTVTLAFRAMKTGSVAIGRATGTLLERSLGEIRDLVDYSLAEARLTSGLTVRHEVVALDELIAEVRIAVGLDPQTGGNAFTCAIEPGLVIAADREMLLCAITTLMRNALRCTRASGNISLSARSVADRVLISVEDSCGGLTDGAFARMFLPSGQPGGDRISLGLSISRCAIEANAGILEVRNLPGTGCVFTIDLPRSRPAR